jgi:hypothetical protein
MQVTHKWGFRGIRARQPDFDSHKRSPELNQFRAFVSQTFTDLRSTTGRGRLGSQERVREIALQRARPACKSPQSFFSVSVSAPAGVLSSYLASGIASASLVSKTL